MELRLFGPDYETVVDLLRGHIKAGQVDRLWYAFPETRILTEHDQVLATVRSAFGQDLFTGDGEEFAAVVGDALKRAGLKMATAESCTGGLVGDMITDIPGSSEYYTMGVISYSNQAKQSVLGVDPALLQRFGAVSGPVVRQMVAGVIRISGADCGVAISGIAGPGGGSVEKPVGTVFIAAAWGDKTVVKRFQFGENRRKNKVLSAYTALNMLRRLVLTSQKETA